MTFLGAWLEERSKWISPNCVIQAQCNMRSNTGLDNPQNTLNISSCTQILNSNFVFRISSRTLIMPSRHYSSIRQARNSHIHKYLQTSDTSSEKLTQSYWARILHLNPNIKKANRPREITSYLKQKYPAVLQKSIQIQEWFRFMQIIFNKCSSKRKTNQTRKKLKSIKT